MSVSVSDSILNSVKKVLGIEAEDTSFDVDIVMHINTVFSTLYQLGVGPETPYHIEDETQTWDEFTTSMDLIAVKSYMYMKVRLIFDPPSTTTMYEAIDKHTKEFEWRLNVAAEDIVSEDDDG